MIARKRIFVALTFLALAFVIFTPLAEAKKSEYAAVCQHIKTKYQGKKVKIPFMWLARTAVKIIRPAGVKSFKVTIFRNLNFSKETLHKEMQQVMSDAFSDEWTPVFRLRKRQGNQIYVNMRESGKNVKVLFVKIERDEAIVVRAKFSPKKLTKFIENPKILGISLDSGNKDEKERKDEETDDIIFEEDESEDGDDS